MSRRLLPLLLLVLAAAGCAGGGSQPPEAATAAPIQSLADDLVAGAETDREKAVRIFDYVRDEVIYGFTRRFDDADPLFTIDVGRGHCNPQTELFVALLHTQGIEARQVFVTIEADILDGLMPAPAPELEELNHSYAEVNLDGRWIRVDGYAVDPALLAGATARLRAEGLEVGYGAHLESCNAWDGREDCMSQFVDPAMIRPDGELPLYPDADAFYESEDYTQRMTGFTAVMYRWFGKGMMNRKLAKIRRKAPETPGETAVPEPIATLAAGGGS